MRRVSVVLPTLLVTSFVPRPAAASTCSVPAFSAPRGYDAGADSVRSERAIGAGDLNGDGAADLVAADHADNLYVLLAAGDGTFAPARRVALRFWSNPNSQALPVADFNGDGNADVAIATADFFGDARGIEVLFGDGSGDFPSTTFIDFGQASPAQLVPGDFNEDGASDLAIALWSPDVGAFAVMLANGSGGFGAPAVYVIPAGVHDLAPGDFDGDGHVDLALALANPSSHTLPSSVQIWRGNGAGGFGPAAAPQSVGVQPQHIVAADLNGDGAMDVATSNRGASVDETTDSVTVILGDGAGGFASRRDYGALNDPWSLAAADVNGDGLEDLLVSDVHAVAGGFYLKVLAIRLQRPDGTLGTPSIVLLGEEWPGGILRVADFDADNRPDVAATYPFNPSDESDRDIVVLRNLCGNVADLAAGVADAPDPVMAGHPITYTIDVTNNGPDLAAAVVTIPVPQNLLLVSAGSDSGVCLPNSDGSLFSQLRTVTCSVDVPFAAPGNRATITLVLTARRGGTYDLPVTVAATVADPDPSNNTATASTFVRMPGGTGFGIAEAAGGGTLLTWTGGDAQAGYFVGRLVDGVHTVFPSNGVPLAADATSFVDPSPVPGRTNCYSVTPVDDSGAALGVSDLLCIVPGTSSASGGPVNFTLRLNQSPIATLTWDPPGGQTGYWFGVHIVNRQSGGQLLPADATSTSFFTFSRTTCFTLAPMNGSTAMGNSAMLCGVPGRSTLPR